MQCQCWWVASVRAVLQDGNVLVVSGETVIAQLHFTKSASHVNFSVACTALQDNASLPLLFFVRKGSRAVSGPTPCPSWSPRTPPPPPHRRCTWMPLVNGTGNSPVSGTADPRSSQTGQVIRGLR